MSDNEGVPGKRTGRIILDGSAATAALSHPAPTTVIGDDWVNTDRERLARIFVGGVGADNVTVDYQIVLWYCHVGTGSAKVYVPVVIASGRYTLSGLTYGANAAPLGATTNRLADTITETYGYDGTLIHSPQNDRLAWMEILLRNAHYIQIETDVVTATSADVMMQFADDFSPAGGLGDVGIGSRALKTAVSGNQMIAVPTTSEALVAVPTMVTRVWIQAKRAAAPNVGVVYLQWGTATGDLSANHFKQMSPGDHFEIEGGEGEMLDLGALWADAAVATDGILFSYLPA